MSEVFHDIWRDLRRRRVFRVAAIYAAGAWLVAQIADVIVPAIGLPDWILSAIVVFAMLGFPVVLVLGWMFDVGPDGVARTKPSSTAGVLSIVVSLTLLAAGTGGFVWLLYPEPRPANDLQSTRMAAAPNSVAILPFANLSADLENLYFSDGLTETILHMLAQVDQLKVSSRTSTARYRDSTDSIENIAAALNVAHVLEGSVQRSGDRLRVTAQLIRANDGFHAWSRNYDRTIGDVFAIQDDIAAEVATLLAATVLPTGQRVSPGTITTKNVEAYDLYLQARHLQIEGSTDTLRRSEALLREALELDPGFIDARAALAFTLLNYSNIGLASLPEVLDDIHRLTDEVLADDPNHSRAQMIRLAADIQIAFHSGDADRFADIKQEMKEAARISPGNSDIKVLLAWNLNAYFEPEDALLLLEQAVEIDPLNPEIYFARASTFASLKDWDEAERAARRGLELSPESPAAYRTLAAVLDSKGDFPGYVANTARAIKLDRDDTTLVLDLAITLYAHLMVDEADSLIANNYLGTEDSPVGNLLALERARALNDHALITAAARKWIEESPGDQCCPQSAVESLLRIAAIDGHIDETVAYIEKHYPGFSDLTRMNLPLQLSIARMSQINALATLYTKEELDSYIVELDKTMRKFTQGGGIERAARVYAGVLVLQGELEQAREVVLDRLLAGPAVGFPSWREFFRRPAFQELIEDREIKEALERWDEQQANWRTEARAILIDEGLIRGVAAD